MTVRLTLVDARLPSAYHLRMPFTQQFPSVPDKKTKHIPSIALLFFVGFLTFLVGLGIGLGQGLHAQQTLQKENGHYSVADADESDDSLFKKIVGIGSSGSSVSGEVDFDQFWTVWNDLKSHYYGQDITDEQLFYGALRGLAESVQDPYTSYFEPEDAEAFEEDMRGEFSGIGAEIGVKHDELQIIAPLPDSPAERAGIRARDLILKIDGEDSLYMSTMEAVMKIRGEKGTDVTLTVGRITGEGSDKALEEQEITITRDTIIVKSATLEDLGDGVFVIELRSFNEDVADTFNALARQALEQGATSFIIDVRNNPGGYLDKAVEILGNWLPGKDVVLQRRQGEIINRFQGIGNGMLQDIPTIVLINEGSASASEILAGALQDWDKADIVGMTSFGKGTVQDYIDYEDGSAIKITVSEWLTPKERSIDKEGIAPDIEVSMTSEDYNEDRDPQLDKAVEIIKTP